MRKPFSGQRPPRGGGKGPADRESRPTGRPEGRGEGRSTDSPAPRGPTRPDSRQDARSGAPARDRSERRPEGGKPGKPRFSGPRFSKDRPAGSLPSGARPGGGVSKAPPPAALTEPMRIAKAMARAGLCSRREAERWIEDGRVAVNGKILTTPACEVGPGDKVVVDGRPLPAAEPVQLWRYHKIKGVVTTNNDPEGRPTVFDKLPPEMPRVISIGRLDYNTEGLLLLTNDGALARHLELPATGWLRRYRVRARGRVTQADLDKLKDGIEIEGIRYSGIDATIDTVQGANIWLTVGIREGKNREVRKVMAELGLEVSRLIRISFGPFELADLVPGAVEPVRRKHLAEQLGPKVAGEFGLTETPEQRKERHTRGKQKTRTDEDDT
ncbi:MAG: pseudouridine synthase [Hyphomicrobium sp. 32-62-53]|nr:MAG: pseudouridine synthase [Hyphomicrobium sp. 12-62-95]OYY01596.1 MAG: pseudouridine synthase [Hyphomicrobium sp. 32-62-53]